MKKQYKRLRELLRHELVPEMPEKEFCSLDLIQLQELIDRRRSESKEGSPENLASGECSSHIFHSRLWIRKHKKS